LPKNTPLGFFIAVLAFVAGFAIVWHIWWLAPLAALAMLMLIIKRTTDDNTEYTIPAAEVAKLDKHYRERYA
jgi:cytochrome o ubiquinol oxidase subunit 1